MTIRAPLVVAVVGAASFAITVAVGCSAIPDVEYDYGTVDSDAGDADMPLDSGADTSAAPGPDAAPSPQACTKGPCWGTACAEPLACRQCDKLCKGKQKKCCANVSSPGVFTLRCVEEKKEKCAGEAP